jgi:hypothetical protein
MSQENVDLHRRAAETFNTHDVEAFITRLHPSVEYHSVMTVDLGISEDALEELAP